MANHPIPKEGNAKECSNYCVIALIPHTSKVMLKILQVRLQQFMNWELPDIQAGFRKGIETRDQITNSRWIIEKAREFQKNIYFCFTDNTKAFDCGDHNKLENSSKDGNTRPPYLPSEKSVYKSRSNSQNQTWTKNWLQSGKGVRQGCILSLCLFNLCAEYIMRKDGLEEAPAGIKIAGRNINNLRYADDTTLMAESEEELKASWCKWKRRVKKLA